MNLNKCDMAEKYLKWLMLREIIGEYMDDEYNELHIGDKEYDVKKMKADYKRLTYELLNEYEFERSINIGDAKITWDEKSNGIIVDK